MSVKVHEAYCLDAMQDRCDGFDHFWGASLDARWRGAGTGSIAVADAVDGGVCRLTTGAGLNDAYAIDWGDIRSLLISKNVTIEYRVKFNDESPINVYMGLLYDANNRVEFIEASANWEIRNRSGGTSDQKATGIALDTNWHIYRIECFPAGEVHFYYDNVECTNSPVTTRIPTDYLQPYLQLQTQEAILKYVDIDYIWWRQNR